MAGVDAGFSIDLASIARVRDQIIRTHLRAGKEAIGGATKRLERALEDATRQAVPGQLWRAWGSEVYPRGAKIAREPVGEVFVNGKDRTKGAMSFWSQPGQIIGRSNQWLAIPLPAAGSRGRSRMLTPSEWEARTGQRLRFVYRGGNRPALLVAEGTTNARSGSFRAITRKRTAADARRGFQRGVASIPIFVLVPSVRFGNTVAIEPIVAKANDWIRDEFLTRVGQIG